MGLQRSCLAVMLLESHLNEVKLQYCPQKCISLFTIYYLENYQKELQMKYVC